MTDGTVNLRADRRTVARPRSGSRDRIINSTRILLRRQGYHGTGLAQIIEHSGAPRGSVYFLFPGGKEQMAVEAVTSWAAELTELIKRTRAGAGSARQWVETMAEHFGEELRGSGFTEGLPLTTIALDSVPASAALTASCRLAYDGWLAALVEGLTGFGVPESRAADLAELMLAAVEGAVLLCRVYQSIEPLQRISPQVLDLVTAAESAGHGN
jgi:TetR/AcrR family transcriptional repressor of lmrAB and yxaGH operons